jgi:hypothetical protein
VGGAAMTLSSPSATFHHCEFRHNTLQSAQCTEDVSGGGAVWIHGVGSQVRETSYGCSRVPIATREPTASK